MSKRIAKEIDSFKYKGEPIKITIGTLVLTCLCVLLIIVSTFTQFTIKHPYIPIDELGLMGSEIYGESFDHFIKTYKYIPQIPTVFFIVALLGRKFGLTSIIMYIILGLFFPIFALGGGIQYLFEYGFGYILAFLPAIFFAGTLLKGKTDFLRVFLISIIGVVTIHVLGILYMFFIATLRHAPIEFVTSWIYSQSGIQILYDIFFSMIAIFLGRQTRKLVWIVMC